MGGERGSAEQTVLRCLQRLCALQEPREVCTDWAWDSGQASPLLPQACISCAPLSVFLAQACKLRIIFNHLSTTTPSSLVNPFQSTGYQAVSFYPGTECKLSVSQPPLPPKPWCDVNCLPAHSDSRNSFLTSQSPVLPPEKDVNLITSRRLGPLDCQSPATQFVFFLGLSDALPYRSHRPLACCYTRPLVTC